MKIYSLQEENEKLKARQGIRPLNNGNVFEAGGRSAPARQPKTKASPAQRKTMPASPASPKRPAPAPAPNGNPPQRGRGALVFIRILWIVIMLFFVVLGFLADK